MRYYVDFENVGTNGLSGIASLSENDAVRIYYSNNPALDMNVVAQIAASPAKMTFIKMPAALKMMNFTNALDIVILMDIYRIAGTLGSNYVFVISNDKGFDTVISDINKTNNFMRIFRSGCIKSAIIPSSPVQAPNIDLNALNNLFTNKLSKYNQHKDKIINIVKTSKSRCEINNRINKVFSGEQTKTIMAELKPIIKTLPGK